MALIPLQHPIDPLMMCQSHATMWIVISLVILPLFMYVSLTLLPYGTPSYQPSCQHMAHQPSYQHLLYQLAH